MKGLVLADYGKAVLQNVEIPNLVKDTDVVVKITLTTICGSDLHLMYGHIPTTPGYVLGHEYVGIVEKVGQAVKNLKPGDRVIGPAAPFCGQCENCRNGNIAQCMNGGIHGSGKEFGNLSGTHSEYIRVPYGDVNLVHIPDNLNDEQVIFVGDIFSTGYTAVEKAKVKPGDTVVIFGAGPVGLCAVKSAKLFGVKKIIVIGRKSQLRLDTALKLGATDIIRTDMSDPLSEIARLTDGKGADAAIEASGSELALQQAVKCVGIGGRVSLVGLFAKEVSLPLNEVFIKNITIEMGLGYLGNMERLLGLIESGHVDLTPLITHRMKLEEIEEALKIFEHNTKEVIKILIKP